MELAFEQIQCSCLQRAAHMALTQEQTQELIIPDSMPDAARTLMCYAVPELQSKTSRTGSLLVSGNLRTSCLYADETGAVQLLRSDLPFSVQLENSALQETTQCVLQCSVRSADSRLINSRKVLLRIGVLVQADGYEPDTRTLAQVQGAPACLQMRCETYRDLVPAEIGECAVQVSEELQLPEGKAPIDRMVSCQVQAALTEQSLHGDKVLFKGTAYVHLSYLDEAGGVGTAVLPVPFSQYCQLQKSYDGQQARVTLCLTGVQLEPVSADGGQKLLFGAGFAAQCMALEEQELTVCTDAYATKGAFTPQWTGQDWIMHLDTQTLREPVRQTFEQEAAVVLDSRIYPDAPTTERVEGGVVIHVPLRADVLYRDAGGAVQAAVFRTEATCRTELRENGLCDAQLQLQPEGYLAAGGGGIELRCDALFQLQSYVRQKLQSLSGGTLEQQTERGGSRPSVIICRCADRQELWQLAKQYRTTAHAIEAANHLTQPEVEAGRLLLIPM